MLSLLMGAILAISMNVLLIPVYGFVGAASTSIVVHIFLAIILLPQSLRAMPMRLSRHQIYQWLAFSGLLAAGLWLFIPLLQSEIYTVAGLVAMALWMGVIILLTKLHKSLIS